MNKQEITTLVERLWYEAHPLLVASSERLTTADPNLITSIERYSNDAFLMRGYVTFCKSPYGDEIAIGIDIQSDNEQMSIVSDVCMDNGEIIAEGPTAIISTSGDELSTKRSMDEWLEKFTRFLDENEPTILKRALILQ